jgi:tRNA A37 threonylcarbamoyltransferase TsaD
MNTQRDGFSGFLDGYRAQNLESVSDYANSQIKQMQEIAKNLQGKYHENKASSLFQDISTIDFSSKSLAVAGGIIKALILRDKAESIGLRKDDEFRMLVVYYMGIVNLVADNMTTNIALEVGDLLGS